MTDSCEIDVEVGGSIRISNTEETVTESRKDSTAKEASALEKTSRRRAIEKTIIWKTFKSIVFFICLIFLIIQSVEFLILYYKYPTTIETEITVAKEFKLPAITLCFRNTISFQKFCSFEPDHCANPSNMEEFCKRHPIFCKGGNSTSKIPMTDPKSRKTMQLYLFNDNYNDARLFYYYRYASKARTFIDGFENYLQFLKCYSDNLHLYQSESIPITWKFDFDNKKGDLVSWIKLNQMNLEPFYPTYGPQVFLAVHSPYLPINIEDLHAIKPGKRYQVNVQLMCLELCRSEYVKVVSGCDWGVTMVPSVHDLCVENSRLLNVSSEQRAELQNKRLICFQNCKQGCLKLQYKYRIKESTIFWKLERSFSFISFYVRNPEVTVLRHVPLYGSGEIFSHVGGLLGCWLGISVFTFTDIMEKFFKKVVRWKKRSRKRRKQKSPTSLIHHD